MDAGRFVRFHEVESAPSVLVQPYTRKRYLVGPAWAYRVYVLQPASKDGALNHRHVTDEIGTFN